MNTVAVRDYGTADYSEIWQIQKDLQKDLIAGNGTDTLILCEHNPVITIGRSGSRTNLLVSDELLAEKGISVLEIERGGDITYHGPGQLVGYPILNLNNFRRDVGWYMRSLEQVIIDTLNGFGIQGLRLTGRTGVWAEPDSLKIKGQQPHSAPAKAGCYEGHTSTRLEHSSPYQNAAKRGEVWTEIGAHGTNSEQSATLTKSGLDQEDRAPICPIKIASIGVRISRWVTLHGFSLNVQDCSEGFSLINPCGFKDIRISSMEEIAKRNIGLETVKRVLIENFKNVFR